MARSESATESRTTPLGLDLWSPRPLALDPRLADWLSEPGLLTTRVRSVAGDSLRLKVVRQELGTLSGEQRARLGAAADNCFVREIELCVGRRPWIYAQTLVPDGTLSMLPWLAELGDTSLGEMLAALRDVTRNDFEYADLSPAHPVCERAQRDLPPDARTTLPARRAIHGVRGLPILVQEVFLPALAAHALA